MEGIVLVIVFVILAQTVLLFITGMRLDALENRVGQLEHKR